MKTIRDILLITFASFIFEEIYAIIHGDWQFAFAYIVGAFVGMVYCLYGN